MYRHWFWYRSVDFGSLVEHEGIGLGEWPTDIALAPDGDVLYLVDKSHTGGSKVLVIDTTEGKLLASVPLEEGFPIRLEVSPDGRRVLVPVCHNLGGPKGGRRGQNRLTVIDAASRSIVARIPLPGTRATAAAISSDGRQAWITDRGSGRLTRVDLERNVVAATIGVARGGRAVVLNDEESLAYVVCTQSQVVSVVDTSSDSRVTDIPVGLVQGTLLAAATLSPDGRRLYVIHAADPRVAVIDCDPDSRSYHQLLELIETPGSKLHRIVLNAEGTLGLIASKETNQLFVLDTKPESPRFHQIVDVLPVHHPSALAVHDGERGKAAVYVTNHDCPNCWEPGELYDERIRVLRPKR